MNSKILITGGSGFIGTNLIEYLLGKEYDILNIDIAKPKISERTNIWKKVDIMDFGVLEHVIKDYMPEYIIHLAARTDLDGKSIEDYQANTVGVQNLMKIIGDISSLKKVLITSSKFVTTNGYHIEHQRDYCPHTVYGESKVQTEKITWEMRPKCDWCILRPTSIWGPWFGTPYRDFFDIVRKRMYFHIGKIKCYKTYGYIGNTIYQIEQLLFNETNDLNNKVFYLGDDQPYEINEWADEIAREFGLKVPTIPVLFVKILAKFGDLVGKFGIHFPMQSFRFKNMTSDGINNINCMDKIIDKMIYTRIVGTKCTIKWMMSEQKKELTNGKTDKSFNG